MFKEQYFTTEEIASFTSKPIKPLFVYGSLMVPAILSLAINITNDPINPQPSDTPSTPSTLAGFQRFLIKDSIFPAVLDGFPNSTVNGLVLFGLTSLQRGRIDNFEGGLYSRETWDVTITLASGEEVVIDADVYVWGRDSSLLEDPRDRVWDLDEFSKTEFCKGCVAAASKVAGKL